MRSRYLAAALAALAGCSYSSSPTPVGGLGVIALAPPGDAVRRAAPGEETARIEASSPPPSVEQVAVTGGPRDASDDPPERERSARLPGGLRSPMPGGFLAGYAADTGLDIAGFKLPVHAIAAGTVDYAEAGHTLWDRTGASPYAVRIALDEPLVLGERRVTHVWYAHLSALAFHQAEGASERRRVVAGEWLGISGWANGSPHLHLGLLLDGQVDQRWGTFLLEDEVRQVLGGWRHRTRLPP